MRRRLSLGPVALGLVALVLAAGVTGCANEDDDDLYVLVGTIAQYPAEQRVWLDRIAAKFRQRTGKGITFDTYASSAEEQTKLQTSVITGTGPDVYQVGTTFTPAGDAARGFQVLDEADWRRIGGREQFIPAALGMSGPDASRQVAVPMSTRPYGLVYNTAKFRAAGISAPPRTWDEFVEIAKRLTDPGAGAYGTAVAYADSYDPWKYVWMFALQNGGHLISADLKQARLDTPQTHAAVGALFELLTKHRVVDPDAVTWKAPEALAAFGRGELGMLGMVAPTVVPSLEKSAVKGSYAFAPMPLIPFGATERPPGGVAAGSITSGFNLAISSTTKKKDLALELIQLLVSPEEQKRYAETFGDLPATTRAAEEVAASRPLLAPFLAAERASVPTAFTGAWSDLQLALTNVVTQSLPALASGGYDPVAVRGLLTEANRKVQSSLDRQRR
ncbi:extracellular solute-binding protein [Allokutzneria sp. A3M-2-11 16]|uniref:ABC transporter substrate-binding protein n=1 Tax=Allokutzneria sp. A3M-2-11 16 TaxID=2962043 RepID=UPI0020B7BB47|nr:extracellular solute-binding protein [Allokutzneria sp. A3M-2-11 16]MCP3803094.1 extracellular solute-binding protein [Allokutzneria sp. A3M-2-11 16]